MRAAHIDATVSQDASDAFSRGAQLQVVADCQQNDVAREAMASHKARRFDRRVAATSTAGVNGTAALIMTISGQF